MNIQSIDKDKLYDAVIIGGGPAGLTAAIYLARARYRVIVLEKENFGGQITITEEIVNYPGIEKTSGKALTDSMRKQGEAFGAEYKLCEVTSVDDEGTVKTVHTTSGDFYAYGVLIATGAHPRMIGFPGEEEFKGRGVAYCATCDGEFFTGQDVFVIGGGFAAAEESVFLTKYAKHVTVMMRKDDFSCAKSVADVCRANEKITVLPNTEAEYVKGDSSINEFAYKNNKTGEVTVYKPAEGEGFGVFVFAGYQPDTEVFKGFIDLDEAGYIKTDENQKTNKDGIYAAGDVCIKSLRQVVTATRDGAIAATEIEKVAAAAQKETGVIPEAPKAKAPAPEAPKAAAPAGDDGGVFDGDTKAQLLAVFEKMTGSLLLKVYRDERPISEELIGYVDEMSKLSGGKIKCEVTEEDIPHRPCVRVCTEDGTWKGLAFHGVPGGHEFTSFVLGLYNAAGPGQAIDDDLAKAIEAISGPLDIKILVSLSCTMCPDLVVAAQRIASLNENINAQVYDINHFEELKDKYKVMSVPCMVINDDKVTFGKKNIPQILEIVS